MMTARGSSQTSQNGIDLIKRFEGCRFHAYLDIVGIKTIGYGHTGSDFTIDSVWTQEQCDAALVQDLVRFENCVSFLITVPLNQNQVDALVSFTYNLGCASLKDSTLLKLLNSGHSYEASLEFDKWNHAGGHVIAGLTARRDAEKELFNE